MFVVPGTVKNHCIFEQEGTPIGELAVIMRDTIKFESV